MLRDEEEEDISNLKEKKFHEMKENARIFYAELKVPQRIEEILNSILYDKPTDVYGRLSEFFEGFQIIPKLEKFKAEVIMDSNGNFAVKGKLYSTVKNHLKMLSSTELSLEKEINYRNHPEIATPASTTEDKTGDMMMIEDNDHHEICCKLLEDLVSSAVKGISILQQQSVDTAIRSCIDEAESILIKSEQLAKAGGLEHLEEPHSSSVKVKTKSASTKSGKGSGKKGSKKSGKGATSGPNSAPPKKTKELRLKGCSAGCMASLGVLKAASLFKSQDPFTIVRKLKNGIKKELKTTQPPDVANEIVLPIPIVSVISAGVTSPGKVNFIKNLLIIGKPNSTAEENVMKLSKVYTDLDKLLSVKTPAPVACNGAYLSAFEKADLVLGVVMEAITNGGAVPGQDLFIGIEVDSDQMFDLARNKYEIVSGQLKSGEELIDVYIELINKYSPALNLIVDPFRKEDKAILLRLSHLVSSKCFVVASEALLNSAHTWNKKNVYDRNYCNGLAISLGGSVTCSDISKVVIESDNSRNITIMQAANSEVSDHIFTDIAAGVETTFLRVGAPCRGENMSRLNRLVEIEKSLKNHPDLKLTYKEAFVMKSIELDG